VLTDEATNQQFCGHKALHNLFCAFQHPLFIRCFLKDFIAADLTSAVLFFAGQALAGYMLSAEFHLFVPVLSLLKY